MDQEVLLRYGNTGTTNLHLLSFIILVLAGLLLLTLRREKAIIPFLTSVVLLPLSQEIVVASIDFRVHRIMIILGLLRITTRWEIKGLTFNLLDKLLLAYIIVRILAYTILWWNISVFVNRMGFALDVLGSYFLARVFIRDWKDIDRFIGWLAVSCIILGSAMTFEYATGRNLFSVFPGVPTYSAIRHGLVRAQGPFAHPITAGTFGAFCFPLFYWYAFGSPGERRKLGLIGMVSAVVVVLTSSSSGPEAALLSTFAGLWAWKIRRRIKTVFQIMALSVFGLHLVMKAPVWALIGRFTLVGGSDAWHRYHLIDVFIKHFSDWWLLGAKTTEQWGYLIHDWTNHYVQVGFESGVFGLILFLLLVVKSLQSIGFTVNTSEAPHHVKRLAWGLGIAEFSYLVSFMGVALFDQNIVFWYLLLGMVSSVQSGELRKGRLSS